MWAMCRLRVEARQVSAVMLVYASAETVVRTVYVNSKLCFEVIAGMHQTSALRILLFVIDIKTITNTEFRVVLPWELLYADDLVVIAETEKDLIKRLNELKDNVENKGMTVNENKRA